MHSGRLGSAGGGHSILVHGEREIAEDDAQLAAEFFIKRIDIRREFAAWRTLEVPKFLEHGGSARLAARVRRLRARIADSRDRRGQMGAVKCHAQTECAEQDDGNNHER